MAEISITLNGRVYEIGCDPGQEGRIVDLAAYIDQKLQQIARSGAAYNDAHLMVLTSLVLADEIFEAHESGAAKRSVSTARNTTVHNKEDEQALIQLLDQMTKRIEGIAARVEAA